MISIISITILFCLINSIQSIDYAPIVKIDSGEVQGLSVELDDGSIVHFYQGIKYGQAERFKKPEFVTPWKGVYNATYKRQACPQPNKKSNNSTDGSSMSEDCLYLNVFKAAITPKMFLPVMVWIHGGAYISGSIFEEAYDARYMPVMGQVVVISINYRLGPFGFLYSGNEEAPGNQGLHDQILALKWVQKNARSFGGDPNQVTIFGESAGSFAVSSLVLSPLAKSLFHRAIMQSGAVNSYLGSCRKDIAVEKTFYLAQKFDCISPNMNETMKCLRNRTVEEILDACKNDLVDGNLMIPIYGDELLPIPPVEALENKKFNPVDLMFGNTRNEGSGFVVNLIPEFNPTIKHPNITIQMVKNYIGLMMLVFNVDGVDDVVDFYTKNLNESNKDELRLAVADAFGDFQLVCPTVLFGETFAKSLKDDYHYYSYRLMLPLKNGPFSGKGWEGVVHGEDVVYLFVLPRNRTAYSKAEIQLSNDMINAWTKFAHAGNPGSMGQIKWEEAIDLKLKDPYETYMSLDSNKYEMVHDFFKVKCDQFWKPKIFK